MKFICNLKPSMEEITRKNQYLLQIQKNAKTLLQYIWTRMTIFNINVFWIFFRESECHPIRWIILIHCFPVQTVFWFHHPRCWGARQWRRRSYFIRNGRRKYWTDRRWRNRGSYRRLELEIGSFRWRTKKCMIKWKINSFVQRIARTKRWKYRGDADWTISGRTCEISVLFRRKTTGSAREKRRKRRKRIVGKLDLRMQTENSF